MHILLDLFLTFAQIGVFTFGGGYAMIAVIEDICVGRKSWITHDEMMDVTVIAESTPGPIAINCATYVGYKMAGLKGASIATLAVVLPSFLIILLVMGVFGSVLKNRYVQAVLRGLKPCVAGVVLATGIYMLTDNCVSVQKGLNIKPAAITAILLFSIWGAKRILHKKLSPILMIVISGVLGVLFYA